MNRVLCASFIIISLMLLSCGEPNEPESLTGDDGGYKIVSKLSTAGYAQDVVIEDTILYIAQGEGGFTIINVADRVNPAITYSRSDSARGYNVKIERKGNTIFLAAGTFGISVVNTSDPFNPYLTHSNIDPRPAKSFHVFGDFLLTATSEKGFNIADITTPEHPEVRGSNNPPGYCQSITTTTDSNYLLIACGEMGFAMMDISDFQLGWGIYRVCGWKDTPGYAVDIVRHPELPIAYLACGTGGLSIVDYSDTSNVKLVSNYSTGGYAKEVMYENNKIYLTTETRGLQIFDVSNPSNPIRIGTVPTKYSMGICADDKYIYVADEIEGLIVISKP